MIRGSQIFSPLFSSECVGSSAALLICSDGFGSTATKALVQFASWESSRGNLVLQRSVLNRFNKQQVRYLANMLLSYVKISATATSMLISLAGAKLAVTSCIFLGRLLGLLRADWSSRFLLPLQLKGSWLDVESELKRLKSLFRIYVRTEIWTHPAAMQDPQYLHFRKLQLKSNQIRKSNCDL